MATNFGDYGNGYNKGDLLDDRFEVIEKIGEGGFGIVYKVFDNENKKEEYAFF